MSPRSAAVRKASRTGNAAGQLSRLLKLKSRVWPLRVPLIGQPNYASEERRDCGNAHRRICERVKEDDQGYPRYPDTEANPNRAHPSL